MRLLRLHIYKMVRHHYVSFVGRELKHLNASLAKKEMDFFFIFFVGEALRSKKVKL